MSRQKREKYIINENRHIRPCTCKRSVKEIINVVVLLQLDKIKTTILGTFYRHSFPAQKFLTSITSDYQDSSQMY